MLRNVAIPLVLLATEAEGVAAELSEKDLAKAMAADLLHDLPALQADAAACEDSDTNIAAAINLVSTEKGKMEAAVSKMETLRDGDYDAALKARDLAVKNAHEKENEADVTDPNTNAVTKGIATLINEVDAEIEKERAEAVKYYTAKRALEDKIAEGAALAALKQTAENNKGTANSAKTAAENAFNAAETAKGKEITALKYLFCELGDVPSVDAGFFAVGGPQAGPTFVKWWEFFAMAQDQAIAVNSQAAGTNPGICLVPEIQNTSAGGAVKQRAATTFYTGSVNAADTNYGVAEGDLATETDVKKWNAKLRVKKANDALTATAVYDEVTATPEGAANSTTFQRTAAGKVAFFEGRVRMSKWRKYQTERELAFYKFVNTQRVAMLAEAEKMDDVAAVGSAATTMDATQSNIPVAFGVAGGIAADLITFTDTKYNAGATVPGELLNTAFLNRNGLKLAASGGSTINGKSNADFKDDLTGSLYNVHLGHDRVPSGDPAYPYWIDWGLKQHAAGQTGAEAGAQATNVSKWLAKNYTKETASAGTGSKQYLWWVSARAITKAAAEWNTALKIGDGLTYADAKLTTALEVEIGSSEQCDLTNAPADVAWSSAIVVANVGLCKTKCNEYNVANTGLVHVASNAVVKWSSTGGANDQYAIRTSGDAKACAGYSFKDSGTECKLYQVPVDKFVGATDLKGDTLITAKFVPWGNESGTAGKCFANVVDTNGTSVPAVGDNTTHTIPYFAKLVGQASAAWTTHMNSGSGTFQALIAAAQTQADLEGLWLEAHYQNELWKQCALVLAESSADSSSKNFYDWMWKIDPTLKTSPGNADNTDAAQLTYATRQLTLAQNDLDDARARLASLQADLTEATAAQELLVNQIQETILQVIELHNLTKSGSIANDGLGGVLFNEREMRRNEYAVFDDGASGGLVADLTAQLAAQAKAIVTKTDQTDTLFDLDAAAKIAYDNATGARVQAQNALNAKLGNDTLVNLRLEVTNKMTAWDAQKKLLDADIKLADEATTAHENAVEALAQAKQDCMVKAYDKYREQLDTAIGARDDKIIKIEELLQAQKKAEKKPGEIGARCEKALSNGTWRPSRGEETCGEGNCCGAARVWMGSGVTSNAAWRTVETCQKEDTETYTYQPPRGPMDVEMPPTESAAFACVEGAKTLAAAASAVAAAVYMLA